METSSGGFSVLVLLAANLSLACCQAFLIYEWATRFLYFSATPFPFGKILRRFAGVGWLDFSSCCDGYVGRRGRRLEYRHKLEHWRAAGTR